MIALALSFGVAAQTARYDRYDGLKPEDQRYYKNEAGQGLNQLERIDSTVKEINRLHGEIATLRAELQTLRKDVDELKKAK
jgi:hypothetical protein